MMLSIQFFSLAHPDKILNDIAETFLIERSVFFATKCAFRSSYKTRVEYE